MCTSCEVVNINGVNCHEFGCPDAWKEKKKECLWCGQVFIPEERHQRYCSEDCRKIDSY